MNNYQLNIEEIYKLEENPRNGSFVIRVLNKELFPIPTKRIGLLDEAYTGYIDPNGLFYPSFKVSELQSEADMIKYADALLELVLKDSQLKRAYLLCKKMMQEKGKLNFFSSIIDYYLVGHLKYCKVYYDQNLSKLRVVLPNYSNGKKIRLNQFESIKKIGKLYYKSKENHIVTPNIEMQLVKTNN